MRSHWCRVEVSKIWPACQIQPAGALSSGPWCWVDPQAIHSTCQPSPMGRPQNTPHMVPIAATLGTMLHMAPPPASLGYFQLVWLLCSTVLDQFRRCHLQHRSWNGCRMWCSPAGMDTASYMVPAPAGLGPTLHVMPVQARLSWTWCLFQPV